MRCSTKPNCMLIRWSRNLTTIRCPDFCLLRVWSFLHALRFPHISPSLLADSRDWRNLTYALDVDSKGSDFRARSISSTELFERVHKLVSEFTEEDRRFCLRHADRRNAELHTGELAFEEDLDWRPRFFHVCTILVNFMGRELIDLVPDHKTAQKMLDSLRDTTAKSVNQVIRAHETVWSGKTEEERARAAHDAEIRASPNKGHRCRVSILWFKSTDSRRAYRQDRCSSR